MSRLPLSQNVIWSKINTTFSDFTSKFKNILSSNIGINTILVKSSTFVLVSFLLAGQVSGQTFSLITPALQQKLALSNLLKSLGLDSTIKGSALTASSSSSSSSSTLSSSISNSSNSLNSNSSSTNSNSVSSTSSSIIPTVVAINFGTGLNLNVAVQCVDSVDDGTFSIVIGYNSTAPRKEITTGSLVPNRPVIHTHFDRLDKDTLDYNDPNITTKLSGPITYFKGVSGTSGASSTVADQKAMIIQGQGSETVVWNFTVDGVAYRVGADKNYGTKCNKPTIKTVNAADNIIPPVDNKYIVYDYSNIFNFDSTFFLATENESQEAGTQVKFYSTATRDKNKATSLWYLDNTTFQIKSKVDGLCLTYNKAPNFGNKDSNIVIQPCNVNNTDQKFEFKNFANQAGYTKLFPKKEYEGNWTEGCLKLFDSNEISKNKSVFTDGDQPSFYWDCSGTYLSGTAYNNSPVPMSLEQLAPMVLKLVSANQSSNPVSTLDNYNKFELKAVDCLENAKSIFGTIGDVRPVAIGQNGETLSVRVTVNNFNQNVNSNTNVLFGSISTSSASLPSSSLSSSSVFSSAGPTTTDRVIECKDIEQMQTADLTSTSNIPNPATKSLYGSIVFGSNGYNYYLTTFDDSGLEGTIVGTTIANDKTRKGQNWYYDVESQQIKSAFDGLCLAPIMVVSVERMGLKKCDFTGTDLSQKWNLLNTFNGANSSRIESMRTNGNGRNCMMIDRFTNSAQYGQATAKDLMYDGRVVILETCSKDEQYVYTPEQNVFVESKIDPRDINLLGLENSRLQKLYNGSVPATSTVDFGRIEHIYSNDNQKIIVGIDTDKTGQYTDKTAFNSGNQIAREYVEYKDGQTGKWQTASYNWKYNSTTKQIFAEYGGLCLTLKDGYGNTNNFNHASANKCSTLDNKQKFNIQKMTDGNYMIQSVVTKECMDRGDYTSLFYFKSWYCGVGKWKGSALTASTSFPIVKTSLPLINILSNTTTNGKKWTLDVKGGNIGDNSELFVWEGVVGNTNQMFAYNPQTNEVYYNPSRQTEPTSQKVVIQDPAFPNDTTKKLEVPVFVKNFAEAMTCLDAVDGAKGTRIKINPCSGKLGQKWSFTNLATTALPNGDPTKPVIKNIAQNFCIDAEGSWSNPLDQMYNGRNAVIWDCTGTTNQQFVKYEKGELLAKLKDKNGNTINLLDYANFDFIKTLGSGFNQTIQVIAQSVTDITTITNGTTTVQTSTSPCYTDTVSDTLVCSIARSPDPILDPLEAILDSVNIKNIIPPTIEETATITKAEQVSQVINNQLEKINNTKVDAVTDATAVEKSFNSIKTEANSVPVETTTILPNSQSQAIQTLINKSPTIDQYQQSRGVINAPEVDVKTSFLGNLNPFKTISTQAQNANYVGSYYVSLFGNSNYVLEPVNTSNYADQSQVYSNLIRLV